ncbi:MAG TPA: hypothetical protein VN380_05025 [Thermoanaerobaculia bacterium]|nr:hypothetical protein [Thermoanaerobaculia bacterium]
MKRFTALLFVSLALSAIATPMLGQGTICTAPPNVAVTLTIPPGPSENGGAYGFKDGASRVLPVTVTISGNPGLTLSSRSAVVNKTTNCKLDVVPANVPLIVSQPNAAGNASGSAQVTFTAGPAAQGQGRGTIYQCDVVVQFTPPVVATNPVCDKKTATTIGTVQGSFKWFRK